MKSTRRLHRRQHWLPAEDLLLSAAWADGEPIDRICADLGRNVSSVRNRARELKLKRPAAWTRAMDELLRAEFGKPGKCTRGIARRIGKSVGAVRQRATKFGLRSYKWWSRDELKVLRARYGKEDAGDIARDLGRPRGSVCQQANKMGLHRWPRLPQRMIDRVAALHGRGLPDRLIAHESGLPYYRVKHIRETHLKLPCHPDRDAKVRAVATQMKRLGIRNGGELRALGHRRYATDNGWPADLRPREVQILNVLAARLAEENDRLATWAVGRFLGLAGEHPDFDDAVQEARIALLDAGRCFDPKYGVKFSTYACVTINRRLARWLKCQRRHGFTWTGDSPIDHGQARRTKEPFPLDDDRLAVIGADGELPAWMDAEELADAIRYLPRRDAEVLHARYWLGETLVQAGVRFGVSRGMIHLIEKRALERLREILGATAS